MVLVSCNTETEPALSVTVSFESPIYLSDNGITILCPDAKIGETGTVKGEEYEVVDRDLLDLRRNQGKDLSKVCVSNVTDMSALFYRSDFNQPIKNWDVSNVTNMSGMFYRTKFNYPIEVWDVSSVTNMYWMFSKSSFNQSLAKWEVRSVVNMNEMFRGSNFNQPINNWCVPNIISEPAGFSVDSPLTEEYKPVWGQCPAS